MKDIVQNNNRPSDFSKVSSSYKKGKTREVSWIERVQKSI